MEDAPAGQPYIDLTLHGEAFCLLSTFYGLVQFYTSPEVYATIGMAPKNAGQHQLKNGDVRRLLDFQPVAPGCVFQVFLWITVQNQICIAQWVIVNQVSDFYAKPGNRSGSSPKWQLQSSLFRPSIKCTFTTMIHGRDLDNRTDITLI